MFSQKLIVFFFLKNTKFCLEKENSIFFVKSKFLSHRWLFWKCVGVFGLIWATVFRKRVGSSEVNLSISFCIMSFALHTNFIIYSFSWNESIYIKEFERFDPSKPMYVFWTVVFSTDWDLNFYFSYLYFFVLRWVTS